MASPRLDHPNDLVLSRVLRAPVAKLWRAWSNPELLAQWWCPKPWTTEVKAFDFRPGGAFHTLMHGPKGETSDNPGIFLEIVPERRIVMTSCLGPDWRPQTSWLAMTGVFSFEPQGEETLYVARALHPDEATRDRHEKMGFHEGWGICADQLEAFARGLG